MSKIPQMQPMNWIMLFFMTSLGAASCGAKIYFTK